MKRAAIIFTVLAALGLLVAVITRVMTPTLGAVDVTDKASVDAAMKTMATIAQFQPWTIAGTVVAVVSIGALLYIGGWMRGHRSAQQVETDKASSPASLGA
jgi:hypothetical protein